MRIIKRFFIRLIFEDPYLSNLQLKRKELKTFNKNISNLLLFYWLQRKGFVMQGQKLHHFNDEKLNLQD